MEFNLADLWECVADAVPGRVAAVCGAARATYAELDDTATRLAHVLQSHSVGRDEHVACAQQNSIAHLASMLACYKLRAVPINVNTRYVDDELAYLLDDADAVAVLYDASTRERVARVALQVSTIRAVLDVDDATTAAALASASNRRDFGDRSPDDHYVLYTGGTTGMPKGVIWRHEDIFFAAFGGGNPGGPPITRPDDIRASVLDNPAQRLRPFLPEDEPHPEQFVSLAFGPLMHASGQWSGIGTLLGGGKVVLYDLPHVDMEHALDLVARERVNAMNLVGDASARPLLAALEANPGRWDTSSLRLLGSGGSILSGDAKDALMRALPSVLCIVEGIGSSESPAQAVAVTMRDGRAAPSRSLKSSTYVMSTCGRS